MANSICGVFYNSTSLTVHENFATSNEDNTFDRHVDTVTLQQQSGTTQTCHFQNVPHQLNKVGLDF